MSERNDLVGSATSPAVPSSPLRTATATEILAQGLTSASAPPTPEEEQVRARITVLEREAKALGADPSSAALFHEIGLLWEDPLKNPRNAAVAFQNAYKLAPRFLTNIRAARRLFSDVGNWQMVLQLLDAEIAASEEPRLRASLLFDKAAVLEERLSRHDEATSAYQQCLELKPTEPVLLVQLEAVFAAKGDFGPLVEVYKALAANLEDVSLRAHYLTTAGLLLEDRLKQPENAATCFREAFQIDRKDLVLLSAIKRVAEREGKPDELLQSLAAEAEQLGPQAAPAYLQLSKVYEKQGKPEDALAALLAARRSAPGEQLILSALASIYETQGRHEDLADVLLAWVQSINDESELVAVNLRLAALYEETLKRDDDAVARYRAILARIPGHPSALAGLGKLYFRQQNWDGSLWVLEAEIAAAEDPKQKAAKMYKAAEILEEKLKRDEEAITRYNQCLQILPGYLPAQKALTRMFERQGRFAELANMYEQDLLLTQDRDQLIATLNKIASIYEDRLQDLDRTVDCLKRILELASDHLPTIRNLARVYERAGRWPEVLQTQELEASLAGDTKQVISLHHRSAEILDEQLKDRAGAIAAYEKLLSLSPSYLPALKNLGRLYAQDGRWEELIRMYRAEAEIAGSPDQAATLIAKVGELYEQKLKNDNEAIASYQEVLTLAPNYFPALRALARIYRAQGAWESLVEVLRAEAANRTDPVERANALFQAAAIWEDSLNRVELAVDGYQEVLRLVPGHATALRSLERLYNAQNNTKEVIAILDRETQTGQTASAKVSAYLKLARLYLDRLNEPSRAAACCDAVLVMDAQNLLALKTLERVRATDRPRRAELKNRLAERVTEPRYRTALRLSAVMDQDTLAPELKVAEFRRAFEEDPGDARLAFALERALRQAGDSAGLLALYEHRLSTASGPEDRQELAMRVADLAELKVGDPKKAIAHYQIALEVNPSFIPALQGSRRVYLMLSDFASARLAMEMEGRSTRDVRSAIDAFVSAGRLCVEHLQDLDGAASNFRKALERDPLDAAAGQGLENILAIRGGNADLAGLHERRAEAKLAKQEHAAAADEFHVAARIWLDSVKDREHTLAAVDRALAAQPTHPQALELKGDLSLQDSQFADAAAAYAIRVQQGGEAKVLSALHLKLGMLYQDHLSDMSRAAAHLQTALSGDPNSPEALDRLANIHTTSRNWTGAVDCLKHLLEVEKVPADLARHHLSLGRILDQGFNDAPQAGALYRRALELTPDDPSIVESLVELYERTGSLPELVQMLEHQAQIATDPARAVVLRLKIGDLYARTLGDPVRAIASYKQATEKDPVSVPAHVALAELYMRDAAAAPQAIEEHRTLLRIDPTRLDSLHALFRLWESQRQLDRAFCAAGILQFFRAANDVENDFYAEQKNRLPPEGKTALNDLDFQAITHREAQNPVVDVLRAVGDQVVKLYPPNFEGLGIDRKTDRLKGDHPVYRAVHQVAELIGVQDFEVYQSRRGMILLETTEPLAICVSQDVVRKFNPREQKFLVARAVMGLRNKTALLYRLTNPELADFIGNSVRIHDPAYSGIGRTNEDSVKQLKKAFSRKALKALEGPANQLKSMSTAPDLNATVVALQITADRAGLALCGDVGVALNMVLRDDANMSGVRNESADPISQAVRQRTDLQSLLGFALSEEYFKLRQRLGPSLA